MHGRDADISANTFRAPFTEPEVRYMSTLHVDLLVVHAIAEYIEDDTGRVWPVWDYLEHRGLSCHDLVMPSGVHIECREATNLEVEKAWHARGYNSRSVGIEVVVPGVHTYTSFLRAINGYAWVTNAAYAKAVDVAVKRCRTFDLDPETQMKRHSDLDPDRKQDPGDKFPWDPFVTDVAAEVRDGG